MLMSIILDGSIPDEDIKRRTLADAGIPYDKKKFSPHITLIRQDYVICADVE